MGDSEKARAQWIERGCPRINPITVKDYLPEYADIVAKLLASGQTIRDCQRIIGVSSHTWARWKREHEEFRAAVLHAKEELRSKLVRSGFERAMGYYYTEEELSGKGVIDADGNPQPVAGSEVKLHKKKKHMPGEPRLLMFLLGGLEHQLGEERWPLRKMMEDAKENGGGRIDVNAITKQIDRLVSTRSVADKEPPVIEAESETKGSE